LAKMAKMARNGQNRAFRPILGFWGLFRPLGAPRDPRQGGVLHQPLAPGPRGSRRVREGPGASAAQARGTPPEEGVGGLPLAVAGRARAAPGSPALRHLSVRRSSVASLGGPPNTWVRCEDHNCTARTITSPLRGARADARRVVTPGDVRPLPHKVGGTPSRAHTLPGASGTPEGGPREPRGAGARG